MRTAPLKIGMISANWGAKCHLPAWRAVPGVEVVAVCTSRDDTARAAAEKFGIPRAFSDFREMAADPDIDVVDVGTRPALRFEMLKAALEAGKHVYAGVPLAVNEKQAEELVELASRKGVIGASDAYFQYIPAHLEMKHRIDRGDIGDIFSISLDLQINLFNPTTQDFPYYWFRERSNGASVLRNLGTHSITMLTSLFGRVEAAVGVESRKLAEWRSQEGQVYHPEISDTASALLRFAGGFNATLNLSWIDAGPIGWRIDVHGSRGRLTARHEDGFPNHSEVRLLSASHRAPGETVIELSDDFTRSREVAIAHDYRPLPCYPIALSFRRLKAAIDGDGAPSPSLRDALHVERILAAISRSTATQMWESVPE